MDKNLTVKVDFFKTEIFVKIKYIHFFLFSSFFFLKRFFKNQKTYKLFGIQFMFSYFLWPPNLG